MNRHDLDRQIAALKARLAARPEATTPAAYVEQLELERDLSILEGQTLDRSAAQ